MGLRKPRSLALVFATTTSLIVVAGLGCAASAKADDSPAAAPAERPQILANRWQEDWSPLADPSLRTDPLDGFKYIPLSATDPKAYLSLGLTVRERFESNDAANFGTANTAKDDYLLDRVQIHADLHFNQDFRAFVQIEDDRAPGKSTITPVDQDPLDLRLAFVEYVHTFAAGTLKARIGRQDFAFDLQRFVSLRDGPNVRQSFDGIWADWEMQKWRFIALASHPVQYVPDGTFNDGSNASQSFDTLRVERKVFGDDELSAYIARYRHDDVHALQASGQELRNVADLRFAGAKGAVDWDLEAMDQTGHLGRDTIRAWAYGLRTGYSFPADDMKPRLGLQLDIASGDRHIGDNQVNIFNPLFPNGYYFSLAGYTGYANLIHLKPNLTFSPSPALTVMAGVGLQWRLTTADAVYTQPNIPVAGTAGHGDSWTGVYDQVRLDYRFNPHLTGAIEAVHFAIGDTVLQAGGHDSNYVGVELKYAL
jgi:hypothetical protein